MLAAWMAPCLPESRNSRRRETGSTGAAVRAAAAQSVHGVRVEGRSLTDAISHTVSKFNERDTALLQALCFGTLRLLPRLDALTALLLARPLQPGDRILRDLMAVGLYQLTSMRIPEHAAVAATVGAARTLGRPWAAGLINAMLRRFQRERPSLVASIEDDPGARWLLPEWLLARLRQSWPLHWQSIADACNAQAPMTLRVNQSRTSIHDYLVLLTGQGLSARPANVLRSALSLDQAVSTRALPGFADGLVSVQDASAQLAAGLLDARAGDRVLDACAAPGGKTAHILERGPGGIEVTAVDVDAERLTTLTENLDRLDLTARVIAADATHASPDWPGAPYQRILLDAPCSATGVIRRHPDIKWLRRDSDIATLAAKQRAMFDSLWQLLAPGGRMVYATCSLLPNENDAQVRAFLQRNTDALERPIEAAWGLTRHPGRQLFPEPGGGDGFYYAVLEKSP
ncbi:MAG: 16S rRNA (cytosine(967)-C(5))-methyltransferase RsmB [Thiohalocapsa sp.]